MAHDGLQMHPIVIKENAKQITQEMKVDGGYKKFFTMKAWGSQHGTCRIQHLLGVPISSFYRPYEGDRKLG